MNQNADPAELGRFLQNQQDTWSAVVTAAGIKSN